MTEAIIGNKWWGTLKDRIKSFVANYSRRLNLDKIAEQSLIEANLDKVVRVEDGGATNIAKAELTSLQIKKYKALVVKFKIKRMSCEATNIAQELRVKELRHAVDRHITSVTFVRNFMTTSINFLLGSSD